MKAPVLQYPSWRYHATKENRVVRSAEEEAALGEGWFTTPVPKSTEPAPVIDVAKALADQAAQFTEAWNELTDQHEELKAKHDKLSTDYAELKSVHGKLIESIAKKAAKVAKAEVAAPQPAE